MVKVFCGFTRETNFPIGMSSSRDMMQAGKGGGGRNMMLILWGCAKYVIAHQCTRYGVTIYVASL